MPDQTLQNEVFEIIQAHSRPTAHLLPPLISPHLPWISHPGATHGGDVKNIQQVHDRLQVVIPPGGAIPMEGVIPPRITVYIYT